MTRRGPGRRPGGPDTRGDILAAARHTFGERGYDGATVREIARRAAVDPALVHHYFGTKEGLFVAAMDLPLHPGEMLPGVVGGPPAGMGERAVRLFLGIWSEPATRAPFLALLRSATTNEASAALLRQFVRRAIIARVTVGMNGPDAPLRATLAASHLVGLALLRYVLRVEPLASADEEEVVALVTPTIQRYLAGG